MSDALIGFAGVVLGAVVAALVGLILARQNNERMAELARQERAERASRELREAKREAYLKIARAMFTIRALSHQPRRSIVDPSVLPMDAFDEGLFLSRIYGSTEMDTAIAVLERLMTQWMDGDDDATIKIRLHVEDVVRMIRTEIQPIADFLRIEDES